MTGSHHLCLTHQHPITLLLKDQGGQFRHTAVKSSKYCQIIIGDKCRPSGRTLRSSQPNRRRKRSKTMHSCASLYLQQQQAVGRKTNARRQPHRCVCQHRSTQTQKSTRLITAAPYRRYQYGMSRSLRKQLCRENQSELSSIGINGKLIRPS